MKTERSDIYALGATLYYVIAARVSAESPNRAVEVLIVSLRQLNGAVSAHTANAVSIGMNFDGQQRFRMIAQLEQAWY
ncbi:MAG: hypothetical protein B6D41_00640 [Chloroflexi bacterium UTCFX4]|nr:MAG: hypothetical protein B6D41_00640 [Chloroflexi bacterium UTCFX4]